MNPARFLSIDCGTQSLRSFVFDEHGDMLARSQITFEPPYRSPEPGQAEQDADFYWDCLVRTCREIWAQGIEPASLKACTLTTQRGTVVVVDERGVPLRPAFLWLDERQAREMPPLPVYWEKLHQISGHQETIHKLRRRAQANWLTVHDPETWRKTRKFLLLSGYLGFRLTGEYRDAVASQVGYVPFDYRKHQWHAAWDWRWQALGVKRSQLPDLVPPGGILGHISSLAAAETGLPLNLPVIASGADKACEVLGAGCVSPWQGALSFGTTATYNTVSRKYVSINPPMPPYPAAVPGEYCLESQIPQGFALVRYFRDQIAGPEIAAAVDWGGDWLSVLDEWLSSTPAGANGLMWQPGLSVQASGESLSRGALLGLGTQHSKADWYRALVEGLLYALRDGQMHVTRYTHHPVTMLFAAGGGSQSDAVMQTAADVFGMPIHRPHTHETSGLGAAICAAVGTGVYPDFDSAVKGMCRISRIFYPRADRAAIHDRLYQQVYRPWVKQLSALYAAYGG